MHVEAAVHDLIRCRCSRVNDPWRRFCGGCGSSLQPCCASCGFVNARHDRFCGGCGLDMTKAELAAGTVRSTTPVRPPPVVRVASSPHERTRPTSEPQTMPLEIVEEIS
jgi:hypothetical protein